MRVRPVNSKALQRSWLWSLRASLRRYADIFFVTSVQLSSPPRPIPHHCSPSSAPACPEDLSGPFRQSQQICAVSLAQGRGTSCPHVRQGSGGGRQNRCMPFLSAAACIWMLRFNNLTRGRGAAERAPPPGGPGKGHLSAVTNSVLPVTFIVVPFYICAPSCCSSAKAATLWVAEGVALNTRACPKNSHQLLKIHKWR